MGPPLPQQKFKRKFDKRLRFPVERKFRVPPWLRTLPRVSDFFIEPSIGKYVFKVMDKLPESRARANVGAISENVVTREFREAGFRIVACHLEESEVYRVIIESNHNLNALNTDERKVIEAAG